MELFKITLRVLLTSARSFDTCQSAFSRQLPGLFGTLQMQSRPAVGREFWRRWLFIFDLSSHKETVKTMKGSRDSVVSGISEDERHNHLLLLSDVCLVSLHCAMTELF